MIDSKPSEQDGRQSILWLTEQGKAAFEPLNERAHDEIGILMGSLTESDQIRLVKAMESIKELLSFGQKDKMPLTCFAPTSPATWAGWFIFTACSTRRNTVGTRR